MKTRINGKLMIFIFMLHAYQAWIKCQVAQQESVTATFIEDGLLHANFISIDGGDRTVRLSSRVGLQLYLQTRNRFRFRIKFNKNFQ